MIIIDVLSYASIEIIFVLTIIDFLFKFYYKSKYKNEY